VIGGELKAVPRGIMAVANVVEGGRGGADIPDSVMESVKRKVSTYYREMGDDPPWK
jgi:hypothetical protein